MSVKKEWSISELKARFTQIAGLPATSDNIYYLASKDRLYQIALAATAIKCDYWAFSFTRKQTWIDFIEALEELIRGNN
jgi:hypothetical protein